MGNRSQTCRVRRCVLGPRREGQRLRETTKTKFGCDKGSTLLWCRRFGLDLLPLFYYFFHLFLRRLRRVECSPDKVCP